ncbi:MAG: hypothetical protein GT597_13785 [Bacteroidales bacterium]|nr:hypothetical protein [Bacteroidales bacterium]
MTEDFVVLDIETASNKKASICQIAIVQVSNRKIIDEQCYLIQPPGNEYSQWHSMINHIDAIKTKDAPLFPVIWNLIKDALTSQIVVIHNAAFDIGVLSSTLDYYGLEIPDIQTLCTYKMTGLSLANLAASLDIKMQQYHNALSDARTVANALLVLLEGRKPDFSKVTKEKENIFEGHEKLSGNILRPIDECKINFFSGKKVVFTGVLSSMSRPEAAQRIHKLGADIDSSITPRTNIVILGDGAGPKKLKLIEKLNNSGCSIQLLNEKKFLDALISAESI